MSTKGVFQPPIPGFGRLAPPPERLQAHNRKHRTTGRFLDRCEFYSPSGERCPNYAVWGTNPPKCTFHKCTPPES